MLTDIKKEEACLPLKIIRSAFNLVALISVLPSAILGKARPKKIQKPKPKIFFTKGGSL